MLRILQIISQCTRSYKTGDMITPNLSYANIPLTKVLVVVWGSLSSCCACTTTSETHKDHHWSPQTYPITYKTSPNFSKTSPIMCSLDMQCGLV